MSCFKTTTTIFVHFFLLTGTLFPCILYAGDSSHKITAEYSPQFIRANHPYTLSFSYNNLDTHDTEVIKMAIPISYGLKVLSGPNTSTSTQYVSKDKTGQTTTWVYKLVAPKAGDILFTPWSLTLSNSQVYTSDSIRIHIYDEFASAADSLEHLRVLSFKQKNIDSLQENTKPIRKNKADWQIMEHLDSVIRLNPNDTMAYFERGTIYLKVSGYKHAIKDFEAAIKLNPKLAEAYFNLAAAKLHIDDYNGVLFYYNKAIELDSNMIEAYANRALLKGEFKDYEGAIKDFAKVIQSYPKHASVYTERGIVYAEMEDYSHALMDLDRAIKLDSTMPRAYSERGFVKYMQHNYKAAIIDYSKAIELDPSRSNCYHNRGLCKWELGNKEGACFDFVLAFNFGYEEAKESLMIYCK